MAKGKKQKDPSIDDNKAYKHAKELK